jgi:hypothetical protein
MKKNKEKSKKEFCKCGHSKRSHVMDGENTRCCACWQNPDVDHVSMCDCMKFENEVKENG